MASVRETKSNTKFMFTELREITYTDLENA